MDLADIWQEHKKFILAVVAALVILLVGKGVIGGQHDYEGKSREARTLVAAMDKVPVIADRDLRALEEHVDGLRERLAADAATMGYRPDDLFVLPPGEAQPTRYVWNRILEMKALRDEAEREDILIPDNLGLADSAPTDTEEIRRTLRALNVIYHVVLGCIEHRVERVTRINIEADVRRTKGASRFVSETSVEFEIEGHEEAIRGLLAGLVAGGREGRMPYLQVASPTEIERVKDRPDLLHLRLDVAALALATEDLGLEDS